ncbi:protein transport protein Sec16A-like isoform X1 [Schistocerca gregaria]|uniref:protein transport protein Sec16A-like isoform X1 n=1 Tax=Schistocerca gregaria TaxID=7010 RepID=UPI00211EC1D7|nr:protein transport protein Sec16A-like isoform X1 [Schistocerca gregaria]
MSKHPESNGSWFPKSSAQSQPGSNRSFQTYFPSTTNSPPVVWENRTEYQAPSQNFYNSYGAPYNIKTSQQPHHTEVSGPPSWDWDAAQINHQQFQQPVAYHHQQQQHHQQQHHHHQQQHQQQQQPQQQQQHHQHHHHQHHPEQHQQHHQQSHSFQHQQQQYHQYAGYSQDANQDPWNWGWDDSSNYIEPQNNNRGNSSSPGNNNSNPDHTWNWSVEGASMYQSSLTQVDSNASNASALSLTSSFSDTSQSLAQVNNRSENLKNNASTYHAEQTPSTASVTSGDNSTGTNFSSVTPSLSDTDIKNTFVDTNVNNTDHNVTRVTEKSDYARTDQITSVHQGVLGTDKVTDIWRSELPDSMSSVDNHYKESVSGQSSWTTDVGGKDQPSDVISNDIRNGECNDSVAVRSTQMQDLKEAMPQANDLENVAAMADSVKHTVCANDVQQCDGSSSANVQVADECVHNQRVEGLIQPRDSSVPADITDTGESSKDNSNSIAEAKEHVASLLAQDETKIVSVLEPERSKSFSDTNSVDNKQEDIVQIDSDLATVNLEANENRIETDCHAPASIGTNVLDISDVNCTQGNGDVENVEIVPPETDFQSRTVYGNVEGTVTTVSQNVGSKTNPYSANKALNRKHHNAYQSKPTVDAATNRGYTLPAGSSEANGKTDPKSLAVRTRRTVDDAEDTVNLETVPDNKERPDFVEMQQSVLERKSVSPMPRLHTVPVGQDAAARAPSTWGHGQQPHGTYYSPENQEVAPVSGSRAPGPDRDQYLETGQLSEETPTPPPGLHRMIPGEGGAPPPGLRRMVPGECSSPDTSVPSTSATEARVVTGVARDDNLQLPIQSSGSRVASETSTSVAEPAVASGGLTQPPSERSETIGSDNVDSYSLQTTDSASRESSNIRREVSTKERERRVADDQDVQDRELRRHEYYDSHSQSPGRYRDEREPRRSYEHDRPHESEDRAHYRRRSREDERGGRRRGSYERSEDEADTEDCLSDRDRRERPVPREGYERYRRRGDRDRDEREGQEKRNRERADHRSSGRERERRRHDRDRTDFGRDEYYGRYYDDDPYKRENHRSRPTSRSGSRPDYDDYRRPDYHGYGYGYYGRPALDRYHYEAYYSYKYYENLRRTNPAAYADWYAKYYGDQHQYQQGVYSEDRGSVHSGRSSENDDRYRTGQYHHHDYYQSSSILSDYGARRPREQSEPSVLEGTASTTPQRLTPVKFMAAHVKGVWTTRGRMLKILPQCPLEGQPAVIEICDISHMIPDSDLEDYPGPLIRDVTHKNSLISFCSRKIKKAERDPNLYDRGSVILLWRLLILLLRQNGTVVGADIAELLVSCSSSSSSSSTSSLAGNPVVPQQNVCEVRTDEQMNKKCEEDVTNQFREYLLYGNTKEALEWAMKHGLWGHALFLASKMDKRTHAQVMMRFANGLKMNDPLQTLYQLMSGRQPAAVTCCADEEWGDWKPHLAMILSNSTQRPELDHKAITTLGDTLGARGCLHAAHFCYLMAQLPFGIYSNKASKLVLIGSSHVKPFMEFATNEAIQMTEIYIYACQLANTNFELPQFEAYKLLYALRLAERGMVTEAIHYIEVLANTVMQSTIQYPLSFLKQIYDAGNLLKYSDPVYTSGVEDNTERDPAWLQELEKFILNYGVMYVNQEDNGSNMSSVEQLPPTYLPAETTEEMMQPIQESSHYGDGWQQEQYSVYQAPQNPNWAQETTSYENSLTGVEETAKPAEQTEYWNHPSEPTAQLDAQNVMTSHVPTQEISNEWETITSNKEQSVASESKTEPGSPASSPSAKAKLKVEPTKPVASSSWFGGLWNKLSLRPKNQMKLPDDKNPSIVWNPEKNRWTNLDADDDDAGSDVPPPPKMEMNRTPTPLINVQEPQNKYKMNRGRSLRANYVDVLGSSKTPNQTIKSDLFPSVSSTQASTTYFIPAPADENAPTDFLTSASSVDAEGDVTQESSSVAATGNNYSIPPMYDPNSPNYPAAAVTSTTTAAAATAARILYPN